jgi:hypothetical protein
MCLQQHVLHEVGRVQLPANDAGLGKLHSRQYSQIAAVVLDLERC